MLFFRSNEWPLWNCKFTFAIDLKLSPMQNRLLHVYTNTISAVDMSFCQFSLNSHQCHQRYAMVKVNGNTLLAKGIYKRGPATTTLTHTHTHAITVRCMVYTCCYSQWEKFQLATIHTQTVNCHAPPKLTLTQNYTTIMPVLKACQANVSVIIIIATLLFGSYVTINIIITIITIIDDT